MFLELTREGDYAVRAMLALARHGSPEPLSRRRIATAWEIPGEFLAHALRKLVDGGLVTPVIGRSGGYRLARPPEEITLLDVVSAVEDLPSEGRCVLRGGPCLPNGTCHVHPAFARARSLYLEELGSYSLAAIDSATSSASADPPLTRAPGTP